MNQKHLNLFVDRRLIIFFLFLKDPKNLPGCRLWFTQTKTSWKIHWLNQERLIVPGSRFFQFAPVRKQKMFNMLTIDSFGGNGSQDKFSFA